MGKTETIAIDAVVLHALRQAILEEAQASGGKFYGQLSKHASKAIEEYTGKLQKRIARKAVQA